MSDSAVKLYEMVAGQPVDVDDVFYMLSLRNKVLQGIVANGADVNFVKTHNIAGGLKGKPLIPRGFTRSVVYIVRNPLDVVLSYARHFGRTHTQAATALADRENWIAPQEHMVAQFCGRWDAHVTSWTGPSDFPKLVLRYEDMLEDPQKEFAKLLKHIGIPVEDARLEKAVEFSSFAELSAQESRKEFVEKSEHSNSFFSKGQSDQWRHDLDANLVAQVCAEQGKVMKKFGYLDE